MHFSGHTGTYAFHLELSNVGTLEKVIELPALQPADRVRLKKSTHKVSVQGALPLHKQLYVWLTKDSTGIIVSFSQYRKYLNHLKPSGADQEVSEKSWDFLKQQIETHGWFSNEGYAYLVRLEK